MVSENAEICGICRDELVSDIKTLDCTHVFHAECIDAWTVKVSHCPFCRAHVMVDKSFIDKIYNGDAEQSEIMEHLRSGSVDPDTLHRIVSDGFLDSTHVLNLVLEEIVDTDIVVDLVHCGIIDSVDTVLLVYFKVITGYTIVDLALGGFIQRRDLIEIIKLGYVSSDWIVELARAGMLTHLDIIEMCDKNLITDTNRQWLFDRGYDRDLYGRRGAISRDM